MSRLDNRPNTAVLVIDMQHAVVDGAHRRDAVVGNIDAVVTKARAASVPVIWVRHHDEGIIRGSDGWHIVPELTPTDAEPIVDKSYNDAFDDTQLEDVLAQLGVGSMFITGAQTDACVRSTLHGALVRGYDTILVEDAHTTEDMTQWGAPPPDQVIAHTNLYWQFQSAPGRRAGTVSAADVAF